MSSNTTEQITPDSQNLEQLQKEIKQEILEILNQSKLGNLLEKYGISNPEVLKIKYTLDLNQVHNQDISKTTTAIESVAEKIQPPVEVNAIFVKPCPLDGNPDGCWID